MPKGQQFTNPFSNPFEGDPTYSSPQFQSGNITVRADAGDTNFELRLPVDAVGGGTGGISYDWSRTPNFSGTGLRFEENPYPRIVGATVSTRGSLTTFVRGFWRATADSPPEGFGSATDQITVSVIISPASPLRLASSAAISVDAGARDVTIALGGASGGVAPYTYSFEPARGQRSPGDLGFSFDASRNRLTASQVANVFGTHIMSHWVTDALGSRIGQTVRITVRGALRVLPLALNRGRAVTDTLTVGRFDNTYLPINASGGTPPYTYSVSLATAGTGLTASTTKISGTPRTAGLLTGTYTVRDSSVPRQRASVPIRLNVVQQPSFTGSSSFGFVPGQSVNQLLPRLQNAQGIVIYNISASAVTALSSVGLSFGGRRIHGSIPSVPPQSALRNGITFTLTATDTGTRRSYSTSIRLTFTTATLTLPAQSDIRVREGSSFSQSVTPAVGGVGSVRYTLRGAAGSGAALVGGPPWRISGTAPTVTSNRVVSMTLTATDEIGGNDSATVRVIIENYVVPPGQQLSLAPFEVELADNTARTTPLPGATDPRTGGAVAASIAVQHVSGLNAATGVTVTADQLVVAASSQDVDRTSLWDRTATFGGVTATAKVSVYIHARFRYTPRIVRIPATRGAALPSGFGGTATPLGGKTVNGAYRSYRVLSQFPSDSGITVSVNGPRYTITGTPATAAATATIEATDYLGSTATVTLNVVTTQFIFGETSYTFEAQVGDAVSWIMPEPAGGEVKTLTVVPDLIADLAQPALVGDERKIEGTIEAEKGVYRYTLRAVSTEDATAEAELIIDIKERARIESFQTPCGVVVASRTPRNPRIFRLGLTDPDPETGLGAIKMFRPSEFIVDPGATLRFDWDVATIYNGVPISEVDFWHTDPELPVCAGKPNMKPMLSIDSHVGTSGLEIQAPTIEGVYRYLLVAQRTGSADDYQPADSWAVWVKVTEDAVTRHASVNRTRIKARDPVIVQVAYRGETPNGDQIIRLTPQRVDFGGLADDTPAPQADYEPGVGSVDDSGTVDDPNVVDGPGIELG